MLFHRRRGATTHAARNRHAPFGLRRHGLLASFCLETPSNVDSARSQTAPTVLIPLL